MMKIIGLLLIKFWNVKNPARTLTYSSRSKNPKHSFFFIEQILSSKTTEAGKTQKTVFFSSIFSLLISMIRKPPLN